MMLKNNKKTTMSFQSELYGLIPDDHLLNISHRWLILKQKNISCTRRSACESNTRMQN